ncbi:vacuolar ATPase assembly integral membrane protein VMA21 [Aspergillus saccharolyticus JOP 1030-1]|uniref:Uncharacterized protein n=1 Tax=Aspergillus saccharolyticus JOP 1030-1 TaxID=1450539 RepID=A0A319A834_9EURO|nr:hypothetical protein BP01DRAFT_354454 [Aspergillus saccharolyticus JOP 1030-1]PYH47928.1 hypothetical protein BP01DRAFT_354454 [Aspergillus saccharolyticus JOP 1030-1]
MSARRNVEKFPVKDNVASSKSEKSSDSDVTPAVPTNVIMKLLGFSAAMVVAPIGIYFVTVDYVGGSATVGGIVAAIMANIVLFTYIYVAWKDDQAEREADAKHKEKKAQ